MNKFTLRNLLIGFLSLFIITPLTGLSQEKSTTDSSLQSVENYREQIKRLMGFLEFSLNTIGGTDASVKEKEIIINESYLKAFLNEKVQVEDDLDENRDILTYKDVQAYLKDVDFFFKEAKFNFDVQDIQSLTNEKGMPYFKVTANRNLQALTVDDEQINTNKTRYIEINLDEDEQVLKIASIYTTRLNEAQELMTWWNEMPQEWKDFLGSSPVADNLMLNQVDLLNDTTFLFVHKGFDITPRETYTYIGTDSLLIIVDDTVRKEIYDTLKVGKNNALAMLKDLTRRESLDVSGNLLFNDLYPVDQMTELRSLNISGTMISDLFPVRNLTKLVSLTLSGTAISDLSPIRYNTRIRELYLDSSQVRSIRPIMDFSDLEILHLSHTPVDSLHSVKFLGSLKDLRLNDTRISDISPVGDLTAIENLCISGTEVGSLTPLQYSLSLKRINFSNTVISDLSPLGKLDSLQVIHADQTKIADLNPVGSLASLEKIYCDHTLITRSLANEFMASHPHVLVIYESQELTTWWTGLNLDWQTIFRDYVNLDPNPSKEQLHQLTLIGEVNISGKNNIISLEPLVKLTNLKEIDASSTLISDISPLSELIDIRSINCSGTRVSSLLPLKGLMKLEKIDFSNTLLDSLNGLENHTSLEVIQIDRTGANDLKPLMGCKNLRFIYCDNTKVGQVDIDQFLDQIPGCLVIYQSNLLRSWWTGLAPAWKNAFKGHTEIDDAPTREQLHVLAALTSADFSGNREITSLEPLKTLHRLTELSIANCAMQDISPLGDLVRLIKLNLSGNPLEDLSPVSYLPKLTQLDVSNTAITKLDALQPVTTLEQLNCSGTQIKKLDPLASLKNLKKLECFGTGINNLKPLTGLTQLKQLICYNTKLSTKKVEAFKSGKPGLEVVFY
jgi:Leucine-rich repeat (LRR) protein